MFTPCNYELRIHNILEADIHAHLLGMSSIKNQVLSSSHNYMHGVFSQLATHSSLLLYSCKHWCSMQVDLCIIFLAVGLVFVVAHGRFRLIASLLQLQVKDQRPMNTSGPLIWAPDPAASPFLALDARFLTRLLLPLQSTSHTTFVVELKIFRLHIDHQTRCMKLTI